MFKRTGEPLRYGRKSAAIAIALLAAAGCSSQRSAAPTATHSFSAPATGGNKAPAADGTPRMSPGAARMAIAGGLDCMLVSVKQSPYSTNNGTGVAEAVVPMILRFTETPQSAEARQQYIHDTSVLWRDETIGIAAFAERQGRYAQVTNDMATVIAGETADGNVESLVPVDQAKAGDTFVVSSEQDVETGAGANLRETVSNTVCGAIRFTDGRWVQTNLPPGAISTLNTLSPPQAKPFDQS